MKQSNIFLRLAGLWLVGFFVALQCARNPVTGKKQLSLMSTKQEIALGASNDPAVSAEFGEYSDGTWQAYLNAKGQEMAKISHRPELSWHFKVVDSPVVNAFALPGGYVYFTRGILAHMNSEAQLMGVLGHEIGHVTARHGAEQYTKGILSQVALIGLMISSPKLAQFGESASQGLQLLMLKNSRENESQSDKLGVDYSSKTGYDAREMAGFFTTLQRISGKAGQRIPEFMSTHPDPGDRHNKVDLMARAFQQKKPGSYKIERETYLRRLEGMIYGDDPKQGYVENSVFYHPEMKFQLPIPKGWKTQNAPTQFAMASPTEDAVCFLNLSDQKTPLAAADAFVTQNKLTVRDRQTTTINGLPAYAIVAEQGTAAPQPGQQQPQQPQQSIRLAAYFIQYNGLIFQVIGVAELAKWDLRSIDMGATLKGFAALTDPAKLNVKPEIVHIETIAQSQSLADALRSFNQPASRSEELAVLNGLKLTDVLKPGSLLKTVRK